MYESKCTIRDMKTKTQPSRSMNCIQDYQKEIPRYTDPPTVYRIRKTMILFAIVWDDSRFNSSIRLASSWSQVCWTPPPPHLFFFFSFSGVGVGVGVCH